MRHDRTNTMQPIPIAAFGCRTPPAHRIPTDSAAPAAGVRKFLAKFDPVAFRHEMAGPTPVSTRRMRKSGMVTRLKNCGPTLIRVPFTISYIVGKQVPNRIANARPSRITLLNRNTASRDRNDSILRSDLNAPYRHTIRPVAKAAQEPRKTRNIPPSIGWRAKEWTDATTPLRVM